MIDILIPSFEGSSPDVLMRCLDAIKLHTDCAHQCVVSRTGLSAAANRNLCLGRSTAELICFMDDDVLVHEGWLERLMRSYAVLPTPAVLAPLVVMRNGRIFCAGLQLADDGNYQPRGFNRPLDTIGGPVILTADLLPTTCMIMRRVDALAVNGFDEGFLGSQLEDVDFARRLRDNGLRFFVDQSVRVTHENLFRESRYSTNEDYLEQKWKSA